MVKVKLFQGLNNCKQTHGDAAKEGCFSRSTGQTQQTQETLVWKLQSIHFTMNYQAQYMMDWLASKQNNDWLLVFFYEILSSESSKSTISRAMWDESILNVWQTNITISNMTKNFKWKPKTVVLWKWYCGWLYFRGYRFSWIWQNSLIRGVQNLWT